MLSTAWQVPYNNKERPQTLEVDLGTEQAVNHLSLDTYFDEAWHNIQIADLEVLDGKQWKKVATVHEAGRGYELDFPEVKGRLFRLVITQCNMIHVHRFELRRR